MPPFLFLDYWYPHTYSYYITTRSNLIFLIDNIQSSMKVNLYISCPTFYSWTIDTPITYSYYITRSKLTISYWYHNLREAFVEAPFSISWNLMGTLVLWSRENLDISSCVKLRPWFDSPTLRMSSEVGWLVENLPAGIPTLQWGLEALGRWRFLSALWTWRALKQITRNMLRYTTPADVTRQTMNQGPTYYGGSNLNPKVGRTYR